MTLAEAVGPDADALTVIILIFLGLLALTAALALLGGVWAYRTGRGSARARVGWICIGSVEVLALLLGTPALVKEGWTSFSCIPPSPSPSKRRSTSWDEPPDAHLLRRPATQVRPRRQRDPVRTGPPAGDARPLTWLPRRSIGSWPG